MADEITIISDSIEIHPTTDGRFAVVREGKVYADFDKFSDAEELAQELAEGEE